MEESEKPKRKYTKKVVEDIDVVDDNIVTGLGDVVKKVTNFFGIKTCDECEQRANKLNELFPFLKQAKELTEMDIAFLKRIIKANTIGSEDSRFMFNLYNKVFTQRLTVCNCPSTIIRLREKLWNLYLAKYSNDIND